MRKKITQQLIGVNLKGKLLLGHGGMDDNVPPYNTNLVVDALIKANKVFDLIMFPNARHDYGADRYYMMRRRWDYFVKNLWKIPLQRKIKLHTNLIRGCKEISLNYFYISAKS